VLAVAPEKGVTHQGGVGRAARRGRTFVKGTSAPLNKTEQN
jgi:hypothetical protein